MEAHLLHKVLNMLESIPQLCPIVTGDWILKGLPLLHLALGCSEICVAQTRFLFLSLSGGGRGNLSIYKKVYQQFWKE